MDRTTVAMKDGRTLELACLAPPLEGFIRRQIEELSPFREPWKSGWEQRAAGTFINECRDRFFLAFLDRRLVGRMWYTVKDAFATFGWVFTAADCRGQGIARHLLDYTLSFMDAEPGLAVTYLGVTQPVPRAIYAKQGRIPYNDAPNTCIMRRFKNAAMVPAFDENFFTGQSPYRVRNGRRSDLPALEALFNLMLESGWFGRNEPYGLCRGLAVEGQIDAMFNEMDQGRAVVGVLQDHRQRVLGLSFGRRTGCFREHNVEWDFFLAPAVSSEALLLLAHTLDQPLLRQAGNLISAQAACDQVKVELLRSLGFRVVGAMKGYYSIGEDKSDRILLIR